MRRSCEYTTQAFEALCTLVRNQITRDHDHVRRQGRDSIEHARNVVIIHARTDMEIRQQRKCAALQLGRQEPKAQRPLDDFQPMRFNQPRVETG